MAGKSLSFVREVAAQIIDDPIYRQTLLSRARAGTLHAAVETMLWHYRYGKPVEHVEVTAKTEDLSSLSSVELAARAQQIAKDILEARLIAGVATDALGNDDPVVPSSTKVN